MKKEIAVQNFINNIVNEVIPKFIKDGTRSTTYTITTFYQMDISNKLRVSLIEMLKYQIDLEEFEESINEVCPSEFMVHVIFVSSEKIVFQVLKMPKCRIKKESENNV